MADSDARDSDQDLAVAEVGDLDVLQRQWVALLAQDRRSGDSRRDTVSVWTWDAVSVNVFSRARPP